MAPPRASAAGANRLPPTASRTAACTTARRSAPRRATLCSSRRSTTQRPVRRCAWQSWRVLLLKAGLLGCRHAAGATPASMLVLKVAPLSPDCLPVGDACATAAKTWRYPSPCLPPQASGAPADPWLRLSAPAAVSMPCLVGLQQLLPQQCRPCCACPPCCGLTAGGRATACRPTVQPYHTTPQPVQPELTAPLPLPLPSSPCRPLVCNAAAGLLRHDLRLGCDR